MKTLTYEIIKDDLDEIKTIEIDDEEFLNITSEEYRENEDEILSDLMLEIAEKDFINTEEEYYDNLDSIETWMEANEDEWITMFFNGERVKVICEYPVKKEYKDLVAIDTVKDVYCIKFVSME